MHIWTKRVRHTQNTRNISRGIRLCRYNIGEKDFDAIDRQYLSSSLSKFVHCPTCLAAWISSCNFLVSPVLSRKSRRQYYAGQPCNWNWSLPMSKLPPLFLLLLLFYTPGSASAGKWPCLSLFFFSYNAYVKSRYKFHSRRGGGQVRTGGLLVAHLRAITILLSAFQDFWTSLWTVIISRVISDFLLFRNFKILIINGQTKGDIIGDLNYGIS